MKPHHVLFVAAVLFICAGVYAAFSTPEGVTGPFGSGAIAIAIGIIASGVSVWLATRAHHARAEPEIRIASVNKHAIATLAILAAVLCLVSVTTIVVLKPTPSTPKSEPLLGGIQLPQKHPVTRDDFTNLVFAASFSTGVAFLAAITLAFLRASDRDEADETSRAPAA
jgi:hypothetical protein